MKLIHFQDPDTNKTSALAILLFCVLIGFTLRFYTFDQKSLWMDEIHTYHDSRDGLKSQLEFYRQNPTYLHPPLFFVLTHLFHPFSKPERDLRIIPVIFGILSVPLIYFLSRLFSPGIALPVTLSLAFMTYHISLSQDGRPYALVMFLGMTTLYFFMKHLKTRTKSSLILAALSCAVLFYTSYSALPFMLLFQTLWFYRPSEEKKKPGLSSLMALNGFILLFCIPWVLFVALNSRGEPIMHPFHVEGTGSFLSILYRIFADWTPHLPLMISSMLLFILFPFLSPNRKNALVLLGLFVLPVAGFFLFCRVFHITHFISSKYFINFLPLFLITLYLSLQSVQIRLERLTKVIHLKTLFVVLFIASNLTILPFYYRAEKQDLRGLANYLKIHLQEGDKIFDWDLGYMPGILHYFETHPEGRHPSIPFAKEPGGGVEFKKSFSYQNKAFTIYHSSTCCEQYRAGGGRLWVVAGKDSAKKLRATRAFIPVGYFDGSFLNFDRFPFDASITLFLWKPQSLADQKQ